MIHYFDTIINSVTGKPLAGVEVSVLQNGSLATIYADANGTSLGNPVTSDANGLYQFYGNPGRYTLEFRYSGSLYQTIANVSLGNTASVLDFGADPTGTNDCATAFTNALSASSFVFVPPGKYKLASTVTLPDGCCLFGAGKSAWEPYNSSGAFPSVTKSEILVNGIKAFNAAGKNSASVKSLSIKATGGTQSAYGAAAGYQASAIGIDITGSSQFEADDISFFGLDIGIDANQTGGSSTTQMPRITNWSASDCNKVFRFGNVSSAAYTVRDAYIGGCVVALHCNQFLDAHWCDGLRVEHSRLFQAAAKSAYVRASTFVSFVGATFFESTDDGVTLDSCTYATLSGVLIARSGAYKAATPYPTKIGLKLLNCTDVSFQGTIQQAAGKAIDVSGCSNVKIDAAIGTPFWTNGNATNASGAVNIATSVGVNVTASFGGNGHWVNVYADASSARTLSGSVSGDAATGTVRAVKLQQQGGFIHTLAAAQVITAGSTYALTTMRVFIPAGKVLKTRSVELTSPTVQLQANSLTWNASVTTEPGNGTLALDDKILYDNTAGSDGWFAVPLVLYNPSGGSVTVPLGHETRLSTVLV